MPMATTSLDEAIQLFDASEVNLVKLEDLWQKIKKLIPDGIAFGAPPEFETHCRAFRRILSAMPAIDGTRLSDHLLDFDEIAQMRFDARELDEPTAFVSVENAVEEQGRALSAYRFAFGVKRRELIRDRVLEVVDRVDAILRRVAPIAAAVQTGRIQDDEWATIPSLLEEIDALCGPAPKAKSWPTMLRHLRFSQPHDFEDIVKSDWPDIKATIIKGLYGEHDPMPVRVTDLGVLVSSKPSGSVSTKLYWTNLTDEDFERLIFALITDTPGYENPEWLQRTNAPDRGRDLSVTRVIHDALEGTRRERVIIQCKHWQTKSVAPADVEALIAQIRLWPPPRVDGLIIATSGRFTLDGVEYIEKHNQADHALRISMWPESHLERLLAPRPHLVAEFRLRKPPN
ncbi:MAG: restriction endonuclease [Gemmataceae bacterium]